MLGSASDSICRSIPSTASATKTPMATSLPVRSSESDDVDGTRNTGPPAIAMSSNVGYAVAASHEQVVERPGLFMLSTGAEMTDRSGAIAAATISILLGFASAARAQAPDGAAIFQKNCTSCHTGAADTRAPAPDVLRQRSPEAILSALTAGSMRPQGGILSGAERRAVAEYL